MDSPTVRWGEAHDQDQDQDQDHGIKSFSAVKELDLFEEVGGKVPEGLNVSSDETNT